MLCATADLVPYYICLTLAGSIIALGCAFLALIDKDWPDNKDVTRFVWFLLLLGAASNGALMWTVLANINSMCR